MVKIPVKYSGVGEVLDLLRQGDGDGVLNKDVGVFYNKTIYGLWPYMLNICF